MFQVNLDTLRTSTYHMDLLTRYFHTYQGELKKTRESSRRLRKRSNCFCANYDAGYFPVKSSTGPKETMFPCEGLSLSANPWDVAVRWTHSSHFAVLSGTETLFINIINMAWVLIWNVCAYLSVYIVTESVLRKKKNRSGGRPGPNGATRFFHSVDSLQNSSSLNFAFNVSVSECIII